ncbi:hypothetical protein [Streptomyces sp. NBC_01422]|uniref:hypothetical protein n=1 Tax=Streptomyces sp. NBC_01422 TaxID=2903859 RepID=UPI002E2A65E0|nr:hypothetical protein [Streptomyces sp. NBC_01422]
MQHKQQPPLGPAAALDLYARPLLAFVNAHLELADHKRGPELARLAWASALGSLDVASDAGMEGDLPAWLANAVRRIVREQTSPAHYAQLLTVVRQPFSQVPPTDFLVA